jgi:acylphosphatase
MRRVRVVVRGRVQGVFFRASCASEARARGLGGWVRNLPDGRLEAAFVGPDADVETLVDWCRRGPPGARVDDVEVTDETPVGDIWFRVVG